MVEEGSPWSRLTTQGFIEADKWTEIRELTDADIHPLACLLKVGAMQ